MKRIWLDCDPGHDDAIAILLACHLPDVELLGVSTVHGNASAACTLYNASRLLEFFAAPDTVDVWPGAERPLIRPTRADPDIHGADGLGGSDGLYEKDHKGVQERLKRAEGRKAVLGMAQAISANSSADNSTKITLIATGPLTNVALFCTIFPELLGCLEEIVFMGGGVGLGNRGPTAEFNILCDPEAAQIVLQAPVKKVMIPLNITHQALLNTERHARLLNPAEEWDGRSLPAASSQLRRTLSSLLHFFSDSYRDVFGFNDGPPLHDALTLAYLARPDFFHCVRYHVDVELAGTHSLGETVVDLYGYQSSDTSWSATGKNCLVATSADISGCFDIILSCVDRCDRQRVAKPID